MVMKIIFSDEAHFDLGGFVNKQNCRIWGTENQHACIEKSTHPKRGTEQGEAITVNGDRYRAKLNVFLFKKLKRMILATEGTLDVLRPVFEDSIISRRADVV